MFTKFKNLYLVIALISVGSCSHFRACDELSHSELNKIAFAVLEKHAGKSSAKEYELESFESLEGNEIVYSYQIPGPVIGGGYSIFLNKCNGGIVAEFALE